MAGSGGFISFMPLSTGIGRLQQATRPRNRWPTRAPTAVRFSLVRAQLSAGPIRPGTLAARPVMNLLRRPASHHHASVDGRNTRPICQSAYTMRQGRRRIRTAFTPRQGVGRRAIPGGTARQRDCERVTSSIRLTTNRALPVPQEMCNPGNSAISAAYREEIPQCPRPYGHSGITCDNSPDLWI